MVELHLGYLMRNGTLLLEKHSRAQLLPWRLVASETTIRHLFGSRLEPDGVLVILCVYSMDR